MESLDDVIDAMIADRVIRRHGRKWLIAIAIVVVVALVILATGGWKERKGRLVPTYTAPATVMAGKWEFSFSKAEIVRKPKTDYSEAKAELRVYFELKNVDNEERKSDNLNGRLLRLVPGGGQDLIDSNGASCRGELNWVLVYGLPPESCFTKFDIPADFDADAVEVGILGEQYISAPGIMGANPDPYWHAERAEAVVRLPATVVVDDGEDK